MLCSKSDKLNVWKTFLEHALWWLLLSSFRAQSMRWCYVCDVIAIFTVRWYLGSHSEQLESNKMNEKPFVGVLVVNEKVVAHPSLLVSLSCVNENHMFSSPFRRHPRASRRPKWWIRTGQNWWMKSQRTLRLCSILGYWRWKWVQS